MQSLTKIIDAALSHNWNRQAVISSELPRQKRAFQILSRYQLTMDTPDNQSNQALTKADFFTFMEFSKKARLDDMKDIKHLKLWCRV